MTKHRTHVTHFVSSAQQRVAANSLRMQAFVDVEKQPEYRSITSTAQHLIRSQGVASLWTGIAPRLVRLCGATIILQVPCFPLTAHLSHLSVLPLTVRQVQSNKNLAGLSRARHL